MEYLTGVPIYGLLYGNIMIGKKIIPILLIIIIFLIIPLQIFSDIKDLRSEYKTNVPIKRNTFQKILFGIGSIINPIALTGILSITGFAYLYAVQIIINANLSTINSSTYFNISFFYVPFIGFSLFMLILIKSVYQNYYINIVNIKEYNNKRIF